MAGEADEVHRETDAARGGSTPRIVRWILGISMVGAIVLLSAIWIIGAALQGDRESSGTAQPAGDRAQEQAREGDNTDGILIDQADDIEAAEGNTTPSTVANEGEEEPVVDEQ